MWAVITVDEDEEALDNMRYDPQAAIATEPDLEQSVEEIKQVIIQLIQILNEAKEESRDSFLRT